MVAIMHTSRVMSLAAVEIVSLMLIYVSSIMCIAVVHTRMTYCNIVAHKGSSKLACRRI